MLIRDAILKYKYKIALILLFVLVENIAWIVEPSFFGNLLDALVEHFYDHEKINYLFPLFIWVFIYLITVIAGSLHRLFKGGLYAKMYAEIATQVVMESKIKGDPFSKTLVRTELVKEYITFLKDKVPEALWQLTASVGAIVALTFYDYRIALVCLSVTIPIGYINNLNRKKNSGFQRDIHDNQEELFKLIENQDTSRIHQFYYNMIGPKTRISQWSAFSHLSVKTLLVMIFVAILFICVDVDKFSTGMIYSIVTYLWTFIAQTDSLPELMESLGAVKDLNIRFKDEIILQEI
ncbi:MAG: ABC transporter six-transmembrane domain-containing protein [Mariniphaga sp.]